MPGRYALARLRVPDLDSLVIASTCYFRAVWGPCDGHNPAVCDEKSQRTKQLGLGKKIRQSWGEKILPICVPAYRAPEIDLLQITIFIEGAGTIRAVVPVPAQGRDFFPTLCIPQFDGIIFAAAGKHASVGVPRNSSDRA